MKLSDPAVAIQNANLASLSRLFATSVNRRFQFNKRSQLFVGTHHETPSVAMRVHNPDRLPVLIDGSNTTPIPSGFARVVSDDLPIFRERTL